MRIARNASGAAAFVLAVTLGAACSSSDKSTPAPPAFAWADTYTTQSRWGGATGTWDGNADVVVTAAGEVYWGGNRILNPTVGTDTVSWSLADGNSTAADVTFAASSTSEFYWGPGGHQGRLFEGMIQYRGEGPLDYRGVPREAGGTVAGVIGGSPFTAADFVAVIAAPRSCPPPPDGLTAIELVFSATSGTCGWMQATKACGAKANLVAVAAAVMRLNDGGGLPPAIGPGTYPLSFGTRDGANVTAAQWGWVRTDAACVNPGYGVRATGGTLTIDNVSPEFVSGYLTATWADGSHAAGTFSAPICAVAWDLCTDCPTQGACLP